MSLSNFHLEPQPEVPAKLVKSFFGTNSCYFRETLRPDIAAGPRDMEVEAYLSIVRSPAATPYDDRRSAIEIQLSHAIDLTTIKVLAVVLPEQLLDDDVTMDFIEKQLNAKALGYYCVHARPAEDARAILIETKRFYQENGLL
jgi:hypothetical protein